MPLLSPVVADLGRRTGEDVEMLKLQVGRRIGHDGVGGSCPRWMATNTQLNRTCEWTRSQHAEKKIGVTLDMTDMTDSSVAEERASGLASFQVGQADIGTLSVIGRPGGNLIDIITYSDGEFTLRFGPGRPGGGVPLVVRILQPRELAALLDALQDQVDHPPTDRNLDLVALRAFVEVLTQKVGPGASNRFENARFAEISKDAGGGIVGHLGLGIDTVGTVHDAGGSVTFSFHVIIFPPGPFQPLSPPDLDSLVAALTTYLDDTPQADPLWRELLTDLRKGKG